MEPVGGSARMWVVGVGIAAVLLAGCGGGTSPSGPAGTRVTGTSPRTSAAVRPPTTPGARQHSTSAGPAAAVDCGPITGGNGATADVVAFPGGAGVAGCTEAITIATAYVGTPRNGDAVRIDGWTCQPQPDPAVPHICFNRGLTIGLRGVAAPPPGSAAAVTPTESGPDVNCGTVTDATGAGRAVVAESAPAGVVGCGEAVTVATDYAHQADAGAGRTVDGWTCDSAQCTKDGLVIELR